VSASSPTSERKKTPLHASHQALGARLIDFGGWDMPVQYKAGTIKEHKTVRESVGLFDVSHMGEAVLRGPRATEAVQKLVTNDVAKIPPGKAIYTLMCYPDGGIVDDCIFYKRSDTEYFVVVNASNAAKDLAWMRETIGDLVEIVDLSDETGLIAVQGPKAVALCARLAGGGADLAAVPRIAFTDAEIAGVRCLAARTGYTGEDGFELACPAADTARLWDALLAEGAADGVLPIGLGARDTLRLEARLPLYGNDIDQTTSPLEAGLGWAVKLDKGVDFVGRAALVAQKAAGVPRALIGFRIDERAIARHGYPIVDGGQPIGQVTSGAPGISVPGAIGLGYVPAAMASRPTITIDCRGKEVAATIVKGKFYKSQTT
jgi:aminomethyltransferase